MEKNVAKIKKCISIFCYCITKKQHKANEQIRCQGGSNMNPPNALVLLHEYSEAVRIGKQKIHHIIYNIVYSSYLHIWS